MTLANLTRLDLARRLEGPGVLVRSGPLLMRLGTSLEELVDPIGLLYAGFPVADAGEIPDFEARVDPWPAGLGRLVGRARTAVDGRHAFDPFPRRHALPMFEWTVNWCVFTRPNHFLMLHSAVVERDGFGLLLSGRPGAGKSTLTAALLFGGWRLLSDEVAMIPPGTRDLLAVPRPVGLKDVSIDIVRERFPDAVLGPATPGTKKGTVAHLRPPDGTLERAAETATPRWIVFPRFEKGAPAEARPVSRAEALLRVAHQAFNYSLLGRAGFDTLSGAVEDCECYDLRFGDLDDALACLADITGPPASDPPARDSRIPADVHVRSGPAAAPAGAPVTGRSPVARSALLDLLQRPGGAASLAAGEWTATIGAAQHARLLSRLALLLEDDRVAESLPAKVRQHLEGARFVAAQHERIIRWEVGRIGDALRGIDTKLILLKGAAYVMAGLSAGRGRLVTDVDVLVPEGDLEPVERALSRAGWQPIKLHPYDQRYYRQFSHELPPLQHARRRTVVDIHHNILPVSGRLRPDATMLIEAAVPLGAGLWTLAPEDMVLHGAAHLFQDGDLAGSVRDLVDADALLREFGGPDPGFWQRLVPRARALGLGRPLYYTLRFAVRMMRTPVPEPVVEAASDFRPPAPVGAVMDRLVARSILPATGNRRTAGEETARLLLYIRSHWLRMPPGQLAAHLARKAARRWTGDKADV